MNFAPKLTDPETEHVEGVLYPVPPPEAFDFIETLTGDALSPVTFQTFHDQERGKLARVLNGTLLEHAAALWKLSQAGAGVFVTVNETNLRGREAVDVVALRALFVDQDNGEPLQFSLAPSFQVQTARGVHAYWSLRQGERLDTFTPAQAALAKFYGTDPKVKDLPHVLRVPGFPHLKDEPKPVRFLEGTGMRFTVAEVLGAHAIADVAPPAPKPPLKVGEKLREGERDRRLFEIASSMQAQGFPNEAIDAAILATNHAIGDPPLSDEEALHAARSGQRYRKGALPPVFTSRVPIKLSERLDQMADEATSALLAKDDGLYQRAGALVRIRRADENDKQPWRSPASPIIERVSPIHLMDRLSRVAQFYRVVERGRDHTENVPKQPPETVARIVLERDLPFPALEEITECPTIRPDGSILQVPGYDVSTGVLFEPGREFPEVSGQPSADEVAEASTTLREIVAEFPFRADTDRAAALAMLFSIVARPAILGPVPLFAVIAPTPGTGKTLLVDTLVTIATGRPAPHAGATESAEEFRKAALAIALDGTRVVFLDNQVGRFGSPGLSSVITSGAVSDRLLGKSQTATASMRAVWIVTGNHLTFASDMARRVIACELDAQVEHPEDRQFKVPNLLGHAAKKRGELVRAVLTILAAYFQAGKPRHAGSRLGGFEAWDDLVRGALSWSGLGDADGARERIREDADADTEIPRQALALLADWFPDGERFSSADVASELARTTLDDDRDVFAAFAPPRKGQSRTDTQAIGDALRGVSGRIFGGLVLTKAGATGGRVRWKVEKRGREVA